MLRFRRYRVFVICALVLTVLLYHVSRNSQWEPTPSPLREQTKIESNAPAKSPVENAAPPNKATPQQDAGEPAPNKQQSPKKEQAVKIPQLKTENDAKGEYALPTQTPVAVRPQNAQDGAGPGRQSPAGAAATTTKAVTPPFIPDGQPGSVQDMYKAGGDDSNEAIHIGKRPGAYQGVPLSFTSSVLHWEKPTELYPVDELIALPTGKPKTIPAIQHSFGVESPEAAERRESRLQAVKAETKRAWLSYKKYAWTHDEVMPVSLMPRDPFCGWAATLVDALDTLWIMGMKEEFNDAVQAVKDIDFTTTPYRSDIPVFETTIRYLGGLLAAYDVSGGPKGQYSVLLDKAIELAEILMGVFDTPNRMPILYYNWKPAFRNQHSRASTSTSIAELGSMTMEFTRLAQLTGQDKYYDAVARITDALEEWQNRGTSLAGIFPESVDASGCNRSAAALATTSLGSDMAQNQAKGATDLQDDPQGYIPKTHKQPRPPKAAAGVEAGSPVAASGSPSGGGSGSGSGSGRGGASKYRKSSGRSEDGTVLASKAVMKSDLANAPHPLTAKGQAADWDCVPQGLTSGGSGMESFSMGGSQDSTYEYFPKTWLLLGGLEPKYRTLHEKVVRGVKKYLLYRPMVEGDRDILFSGKARIQPGTLNDPSMDYEITHLTCFLGGMFGLGGKIFGSEEDVEIGKKLADGCVWAYETMPTGVMAEYSTVMACARPDQCHWNQTAWYDRLDPSAAWRKSQMDDYVKEKEQWKAEMEQLKQRQALAQQQLKQRAESRRQVTPGDKLAEAADLRPMNRTIADVQKEAAEGIIPPPAAGGYELGTNGAALSSATKETASAVLEDKVKILESGLDLNSQSGVQSQFEVQVGQIPLNEIKWPAEPVKPQTHEEYIADRLMSEHLPPGIVSLNDRRYILRPEAIESVWYMYRITGDPIWQDKGWRMFESVIKATRTEGGHSAILDVSSTGKPHLSDNMESFWIAETLKYFYLLFETPDVISLDEWVLNTEAHPFKRPT